MPLLEDKDEEQERNAAAMLSLYIHDNYNYVRVSQLNKAFLNVLN